MSLTYFAKLVSGTENLWVSDGTTAGTHPIKAFAGTILHLTMIGSRAYFSADDGVHGPELWVSDGTSSGTVQVKDINSGASASSPDNLTDVNGTLFFEAFDGIHGPELWKTDGTPAGTVLVKDIDPGATGSFPFGFTNVNGTLFFSADDGTDGFELWKSDGTAAGTVLVRDINPGPGDSSPFNLTNVNGTLFFEAREPTHGQELWKSDGTSSGTVLVKDIKPGGSDSSPSSLTNVNGTLFFEASDGTNGAELWKSDGTAAGTVMVKDINPGPGDSVPQVLTNVNGTLFFEATDAVHGVELWKSDGTAAGTVLVKDINSGVADSFPNSLANVNGTLLFAANDGVTGTELWRSDGTAAGTVMVKDINPGALGSAPFDLVAVGGAVEFYANDGSGIGLFRSDGTAAGTIELATNVEHFEPIASFAPPLPNDFNGDRTSDILWRSASGSIADWTIGSGAISSSGFLTSGGTAVAPDATWSVAGIGDFNGDGDADLLWRDSDGTLADWTMNGSSIASSGALNLGGVAVKPDASWSVAGVGDFDGDSRSDILWRNAGGTLADWTMNGSSILSSDAITSGGVAVTPDASWSVAGIGDFNGDGRRDVLWRNTSGEVSAWLMNGSSIATSGDLTSGGAAASPDASWSIAGIGDFNHDGFSDVLWRKSDGSLAVWLMNGTTITSSGAITFGGAQVTPDASWHVVEIGDFNADSNADILWRNDSGALAEWLMSGTTIVSSVTPSSGGASVSPDATWSTQAKPTNFA